MKVLQGVKGTAFDKLRLALLFVLACDVLSPDSELAQLEEILRASGGWPVADILSVADDGLRRS